MEEGEFQAMMDRNDRHWWYRGRRRIVHAVLGRLGIDASAELLDAGCGSGRTLDELAKYGTVQGIELNPLGVAAARRRGHKDVQVAPIEEMPFGDASFDVVTSLDVIEHTPDDVRSLSELRRVTRPGGALVVTVPAYQALFSHHDVVNLHYRRYRRRTLRAAAAKAGWQLEFDTYFNSFYLPAAAVVRLARRGSREDAGQRSELALTPGSLDPLLELPLRAEAALIRAGGSLPAGLSLLAVLRTPAQGDTASGVKRAALAQVA
ncbi:MAG: class I SAM-dependent methyltransferase [Thermoleophilaceae bacterium]